MRRILGGACVLMVAVCGAVSARASDHRRAIQVAPARPATPPAFVAGEVIVRHRPGTSPAERATVRQSVGATTARLLRVARMEVLRLPPGRSIRATAAALNARRGVDFAQPNFLHRLEAVPNDTRFAEQYALNNTGQTGGTPDADIDAPEAWELSTGSDGVVIGVIDTGVNTNHPDLAPNIDPRGFDFVNGDGEVADEFFEHGTFVAGVAAARGGNGQGMSGVAQRAKILPLQAEENGGIPSSATVDAIAHARSSGARVVNMSFGSFGMQDSGDAAIEAAIEAAPEILFVASAGNLHDVTGLPNDNDVEPHWPSSLSADHANVIAVASTTDEDQLSASSSFGGDSVSLAAPGEAVLGADALSTLMGENFDGVTAPALPAGWTGGWATTSLLKASEPNSLTDSPGGNYAPNANVAVTSPTTVVPTETSACTMSYLRSVRLHSGDDVHTEIALNGGAFSTVDSTSGTTNVPFAIDLLLSDVTTLRARLRLQSNSGGEDDGVYVDDFALDCNHANPNAFATGSGTSFSAPAVAGAAAVLLGRNSSLTPAQLKSTLMSTVDELPSLSGKVASGGRLNLDRAVRSVSPAGAATPSTGNTGAPSTGNTGSATAVAVPNPAVDRRRPVVSRASLAPSVFRPLRSGAMLSATRRGATLRFRVDERSRVRARVVRPALGRRAGRRCVAPTRRNRRAPRCTRLLAAGPAQALRGTLAGSVSRRFSGRVRGRPLAPRGYRLELIATDAAGNRSAPRYVTFRIARR